MTLAGRGFLHACSISIYLLTYIIKFYDKTVVGIYIYIKT